MLHNLVFEGNGNLFLSVMRLAKKTPVPAQERTQRIQRSTEQAGMPFDQLCATSAVSARDR